MKKLFILAILTLAGTAAIFLFFPDKGLDKELPQVNQEEISNSRELEVSEEKSISEVSRQQVPAEIQQLETVIPLENFIKVPFTSQAPYAHWDERHEEACEEASLVMVKYYLEGKKLSPEISEKEIQDMIDFQIKKYGDYKDTNVQKTVLLAREFYGLENLRTIYDFEKEDIKKELAKGNPVIVPAAGRLLGNPYFTPPGPLYHNLVLIGYSGDTIITNDPGTKRGEGYEYSLDTLYGAIHDFPGSKEAINQGKKAMIVIDEE